LSLHDSPKKTNEGEPTISALLTSLVDTATAVQLSNLNSVHCRSYAAWMWDQNSAHELKNYNLQQWYRTEQNRTNRHYQLTLHIYIYTLRQKHKRAGPYNHSNTTNKKCGRHTTVTRKPQSKQTL